MRRLSFLGIIAFSLCSLTSMAQNKNMKQVANKMTNTPYKVENTGIHLGNSAYSMKVLKAWKAYDNNELEKMTDMFTEDVWGTMADGAVVKGREAFVNGAKEYRNTFSSVTSEIIACTALKSVEHPENDAVVIWGRETDIKKDGTTQKVALHEVWFFNKAGKVFEFHQYAAPIKEEMK